MPARADELTLWPSYDLRTDVAVTAGAVGGTFALLAFKDRLVPTTCRWCNPPDFDVDVTQSLGWRNANAASKASNILQVALCGGVAGNALVDGFRRGDARVGAVNALLIAEATGIAMLVDTGVKYATSRERPYVWLGHATDGRNGNLSFFSGHTSFVFAVAASSSTLLLSQHAPGAEIATAVSFAGAAGVGYLRIAADEHYLTDVLAGAAAGTLIGWAVPHFWHPSKASSVQLRPALGGLAVVW
ncbi:MAG TPA: phosphatase PAP2 family protein [Anaeromyxobacteraceae bacterium]|nr:phosphatase PAP2 family protein [Anaeromyxobacteraceae bacterium]